VLLEHGARLNLDIPPHSRINRSMNRSVLGRSSSDVDSIIEASEDKLPQIVRWLVKVDDNEDVLHAFGGKEVLEKAKQRWSQFRSVHSSRVLHLIRNKQTIDESHDVPGGSDERSCALCWSAFGTLLNRRQLCRITRRYVCDQCSSKRIVAGQDEYRVTDGQFLFAKSEAAKKQQTSRKHFDRENTMSKRMIMAQAQAARAQAQTTRAAVSQTPPRRDPKQSEREELFGGFIGKAYSFMTGENPVDEEESRMDSLSASLEGARDALNARGEKLSTLSDKTSRLADQSRDFAQLAKELERSERGLFW